MIIKRLGDLALDIQKSASRYWLNIMQKCKDRDSYYVICGFEYDDHEDCYDLQSVADRIVYKEVNWSNLEVLVKYGFELLNDEGMSLEDFYKAQEVVVFKCNSCGKEHHLGKNYILNILNLKCPYCNANPQNNWTVVKESTYLEELRDE